jgi:DNA-binding transcriptional ArsR family regulator
VGGLQHEARSLGDPTRYAVFRHVADASTPVTVAELTTRFGLHHNAIRQHLARPVCALHLGVAQGFADGSGVVVEELVPTDPRRPHCQLRLRLDEGEAA